MKKTNLFGIFAILFIASTLLSSCTKRITLNRLEGEWKVTSFIQDGDEVMGDDFVSFKMEYEDYDDDEGDVTWTILDDWGDTQILSGTYELNDDADEIELTFVSGTFATIINMEISEIDKDEIELEGFIDGDSFIIKADKDD